LVMAEQSDEFKPRLKPLFSKVYGFSQALTRFLSDYDLGKTYDSSLRTEDIALDLLRTPEMQAIREQLKFMLGALESGCNDDVNHGQGYDWLGEHLPEHVREWVLS
jgi:hypothetical protein